MSTHFPVSSKDGTAHVAYFDPKSQLSFVWNGDKEQMIEISHGGYGEEVVATFNVPWLVSIKGFKKVCDEWIRTHQQEVKTWNESSS